MKPEQALTECLQEARRQAENHTFLIGKQPIAGWSQEKWDNYHKEHAKSANDAAIWLQTRLMQFDPD